MAASWWPDPPVFEIYRREGIGAVVNCSEFDNRRDVPEQFAYYHIHVEDYGIPTGGQIDEFLEISRNHLEADQPVVVHCVAGCGRTGQFLVAWGASSGQIPDNMDPVDWIRSRRRCSLETAEQMQRARQLAAKYSTGPS